MQLGLLQQSPQLKMGMKEDLKEVEGETMRAANLTRQLLLFSRRELARFEPLDLNALITELLKMLRRILGENVNVEFQGSSAAVWVEADAGMLEQVVMNLCINARDAMPKGGRLTVATTLVSRDAASIKPNPDARPGQFACLRVTDTGCGMDETVLKRIFEPFFTTKGVADRPQTEALASAGGAVGVGELAGQDLAGNRQPGGLIGGEVGPGWYREWLDECLGIPQGGCRHSHARI
jgi:signal transduction histidine kinase